VGEVSCVYVWGDMRDMPEMGRERGLILGLLGFYDYRPYLDFWGPSWALAGVRLGP
jgi:hypothetical protein